MYYHDLYHGNNNDTLTYIYTIISALRIRYINSDILLVFSNFYYNNKFYVLVCYGLVFYVLMFYIRPVETEEGGLGGGCSPPPLQNFAKLYFL